METLVNGCTTVNCGQVRLIEGMEIEVLSPAISQHFNNIICNYFKENNQKIELCYSNNNTFEVYFFKSIKDIQHYYSKQYKTFEALPEKYKRRARILLFIYPKVIWF
jgi:type IV secretory pathway VirB6-like protein